MRFLVLVLTSSLVFGLGLAFLPAQAQEVFDDMPSPQTNAVAKIGGCTATLIAPRVLLTAGRRWLPHRP